MTKTNKNLSVDNKEVMDNFLVYKKNEGGKTQYFKVYSFLAQSEPQNWSEETIVYFLEFRNFPKIN
jgi:hypothetical protein